MPERVYYFFHPPDPNPDCPITRISKDSENIVRIIVEDATSKDEWLNDYLARKGLPTLKCEACGRNLIIPGD
ncbi:hypothetical protein A2Z22_01705 [Candidatus Woesebacteria bacterium RBG_16_34_12]|uniref:Uncharacterized protein n=1 Tax=Candidatus Woesebacteria bacterium RBG_16_34_12 TaxID=1802480 RepID=A0A1F7XAX7_9BACT|nr:MAG: hypothetical protein A2Z22_01705 [Candidatus Woesebacteria bacterium RBG_16_34_12]